MMDVLKFVKERNRMCKSFGGSCNGCPADKNICCDAFEWQEELITIVEEWSKEHPHKTRQDLFLEQYPEAETNNGVLFVCPALISPLYRNGTSGCKHLGMNCYNCRRRFWTEEIK